MIFPSLGPIDDIKFEPDEERSIPKFKNIDYVIETIVKKFEDISNIDEQDLKDIIKRQYHLLLNYDNFVSGNREFAQKLFTNKKFLKCLLDLINILDLDREECVCINKLCYDYMTFKDSSKDTEIENMLLSISYYINNNLVIRLSAELPIREARMLAMFANSSYKTEKNIKRVNWFLTYILPNGYNITNIYIILFDHMMYPIIYTLLDVNNNLDNNSVAKKNYDQITATIITLLLCMTSDDMIKVLTNYGYIWKLYGKPAVRYQFKNLPEHEQFSRLKNALTRIELGPYDDIEIP